MNQASKRSAGSRFVIGAIATVAWTPSCNGGPVSGGWLGGGPVGPPGLSGSGSGGSSQSSITVTGTVIDETGAAVTGANISVDSANGTTDSMGAFSLTIRATQATTLTLNTLAPGLARQVTVVPVKQGVTRYVIPITVVHFTTQALSQSSSTSVTVQMLGHGVSVTIPGSSSTPAGSTLRVAPLDPNNNSAPGLMAPTGDPTKGLATGAMFYFDIVDASGNPLPSPPAGLFVAIPPFSPANLPESDPWNMWQLDPTGGEWQNPTPTQQPGPATMTTLSPTQFGYWNLDHAYKTACVTGTLNTNVGACRGARVQALGVDNLSSYDSSGADGSFCVTGAQTRMSKLIVGSSSSMVTMPATPGDCADPSACQNIGSVTVSADQCQAAGSGSSSGSGGGSCDLSCIGCCDPGSGVCIPFNSPCSSANTVCCVGSGRTASVCANILTDPKNCGGCGLLPAPTATQWQYLCATNGNCASGACTCGTLGAACCPGSYCGVDPPPAGQGALSCFATGCGY